MLASKTTTTSRSKRGVRCCLSKAALFGRPIRPEVLGPAGALIRPQNRPGAPLMLPAQSAAPRPKPIASKRSWGATLPTGRSPCSRQGPDMSGSRAHHYPGTTGARRHEPRSLHHHNNPIAPLFAFPQMVDHAKREWRGKGRLLSRGVGSRSWSEVLGTTVGLGPDAASASERGRVLSAHEDTQAAPPLASTPDSWVAGTPEKGCTPALPVNLAQPPACPDGPSFVPSPWPDETRHNAKLTQHNPNLRAKNTFLDLRAYARQPFTR